MYLDRSISAGTVNYSSTYYIPKLLPMLIKKGLCGCVSGFPLSCSAVEAKESDRDALLSLADAECDIQFPIVYLSSGSPLDAEKLAQKLGGTALVLCDNSDILRQEFPDRFGTHDIFLLAGKITIPFENNVFHREIQARVNEFHNNAARRQTDKWTGLTAEISSRAHRAALERIKTAAADNNELCALYDALEKDYKAANRRAE